MNEYKPLSELGNRHGYLRRLRVRVRVRVRVLGFFKGALLLNFSKIISVRF